MSDLLFSIFLGFTFHFAAMYFIAACIPLLMVRKIDAQQSMEDIYSTEPHGKILIFSIIGFSIYWLSVGQMFTEYLETDSWHPVIFYFFMYSISYYAAQFDKGKKTYLQRVLDEEDTGFSERPNFYNQFLGQCVVILALAVYELYLIIFN